MNRAFASFSTVCLGLALVATHVGAVCLDPEDPTSRTYYHPTLEDEAKTSSAIVVATVVEVAARSEDATDPGGWTSFIYKVSVENLLLGDVPSELFLRAANDSGGYRMDEGETHLRLLKRNGDQFSADVCGNSTILPRGSRVLEQLEALLAEGRHAV